MPDVTTDIFAEMISLLTGGIIPDLKTAIIAILTIYMIYIGLDILITKAFGLSIGERLEYNEYAYKRRKREEFRRRYETEAQPKPKTTNYLGI